MPDLNSPQPAPRMQELGYFVGQFECHGEVLDTPFSTRHPLRRVLDGRMDLDGHWFFMRIDEAKTPEHSQPLRGNWQITFDRRADCFVSLWTDNLGRWAAQRSPGWEGSNMAFTGATFVDRRPGAVRDTLIKTSADEMRFLVDFQIDGTWTRFMDLTCRRTVA